MAFCLLLSRVSGGQSLFLSPYPLPSGPEVKRPGWRRDVQCTAESAKVNIDYGPPPLPRLEVLLNNAQD